MMLGFPQALQERKGRGALSDLGLKRGKQVKLLLRRRKGYPDLTKGRKRKFVGVR